ncbi:hypothetical protein OESDEN_23976 [Oesophagostomum dentatum]|uniref:Peptidase C1A papain C-terminal domain-containing protein n=1 Tax=Oesophagostomum dentatum TaxID=61180 RepID=A0A0B1RUP1_OESDE|nr:hypothetical protein OESDEN_23976 [Oesophagostomum dentatum]
MAGMRLNKNHPRSGKLRSGSCWAVSAASAMSDRVCIQSNGRIKVIIDYSMTYVNRILKNDILQSLVSDTDILTCCGKTCGDG